MILRRKRRKICPVEVQGRSWLQVHEQRCSESQPGAVGLSCSCKLAEGSCKGVKPFCLGAGSRSAWTRAEKRAGQGSWGAFTPLVGHHLQPTGITCDLQLYKAGGRWALWSQGDCYFPWSFI